MIIGIVIITIIVILSLHRSGSNGDTCGDNCAPSNDEHSSHYGIVSNLQSSNSKVEGGKLDLLGVWILSFSIRQEHFLIKKFMN